MGDDQALYFSPSFTFSVMWLHGAASRAVGPRNRIGISPFFAQTF